LRTCRVLFSNAPKFKKIKTKEENE